MRNVIFLAIIFSSAVISGCALLQTQERPENYDPIAAAALPFQTSPISREDSMASSENERFEPSFEIQQGIEQGDLVLGMSMSDVLSIWGQPREVETAGNPSLKNQKWIYLNGLSERFRIGSTKIVYFEAGRVIGWETQNRP